MPIQNPFRSLSAKYIVLTILWIVAVTILGHSLVPFFDLMSIALFYLLPVLISAVRWGRGYSFFASILSLLFFDYFIVPPVFGFTPTHSRDFTVLAVFLTVSIVTGTMATKLQNERKNLRGLASRLESIREEERSRIARKIHDELGQALTGLKIDVLRLSRRLTNDQRGLVDELHSMGKLIDDLIQTIRKISTELRPGILDDLGLVSAIEWQVEDFKKRSQIQVEFSSTLADRNLHRDLSTALFRIFQETLTNIIRHAQATHVKVNIKKDNIEKDTDIVILTVEDNGKGITEREAFDSKSLGLLGIRERALIYGGEVQINGRKGIGTRVEVIIPFREADKHHA
jgi:signal transduction histidine kinase